MHYLLALSLLATVLMLPITQTSAAQYTPPSLDGFKLHEERDADGDDDGINETHIKRYLSQSGDSIVSMTTKDRLWAWSLDTHANDSGLRCCVSHEINCDDVFDEVYGLDDEFHVPDCLK